LYTIVLLTEETLTDHDAVRVGQLHEPEPVRVHVLVPVDTRHSRLLEALDEALLGRLREAARDSGDEDVADARLAAQHALESSLESLRLAGAETTEGALTPDNPLDATVEAARELNADEIIVVTPPHLVEEALHRDWASRLRDRVKLPVLHTTAGTDRVIG
jgi:hypothetical protein